MFKESIYMSWQNIIHHKMRSFLTVLGVLIGVASIIALISIVQGVTGSITGQVLDLGAEKITVQAMGTPIKTGLLGDDLESIAQLENIEGISPSVSGMTQVASGGRILEEVALQGKNQIYFSSSDDMVASGRGLNRLDIEQNTKVCLIGSSLVEEFFPTTDPVGQQILISGVSHTVVGTLEESNGFDAGSNDKSVIIPYPGAMSLLGTGYVNSLDLIMADSSLALETTQQVEASLMTAFNGDEDGFVVTNMENILDQVAEMTGTMTMMLAGIASIALVVGGIGIMNMMLVSVTERTSEIGLRKALGAKPSAIRSQFLLEALFLSIFGGVLGLLTGIAIAFLASIAIGTEFGIGLSSVALAIGFSALIGLVFGYAPASKASKLNPIDALRSA